MWFELGLKPFTRDEQGQYQYFEIFVYTRITTSF